MNILDQAEQDLSFTVEDKDDGFGRAVVLEDKTGVKYGENNELIAKVTDIGFFIDPGNNVGVEGRTTWIELRLSTLETLGIGIPKAKDGWKVKFPDIGGKVWNFSIMTVPADRTLGLIKLELELLDIS